MSYPDDEYNMDGYNKLVYDELKYDKIKLKSLHDALHCMEALDRTMCDLMFVPDKVFSGKVVVFGGDFRLILQVIPNSTRHEEFSDWILDIGDGKVGGKMMARLLAILAPTHDEVDKINDRMTPCYLEKKMDITFDETLYSEDFLNTIIPHHELRLEVGAHVMCLRNIDQRAGIR
uniref:ATP-dependent DNA helicase n=1 Tax=Tanacetum cinerariifolium TaxID=118510 RepID=A0A6L2JUV2_TANCI|nr:hypothetical protein [Tanacetum cinerariifolium]